MILKFIKQYYLPILLAFICIGFYYLFGHQLVRSNFIKLFSLYSGLFVLAYLLIEKTNTSFWVLAGFGIVFRVILLPALPNLSQDFYRFLWDGRLLIQGINPYLITPEAYLGSGNKVVPQAIELFQGMGPLNASHYSNYPPVNQFIFAIAALFSKHSIIGSVIVLKGIIMAADIGILYLGKKLLAKLKLPENRIFWYFLNPFIIIEMTCNLHFESVMLFFLVWSMYLLAQRKWAWAAILIGISISVKLLPLLLLPLFYKWFYKNGNSIVANLTSSFKFYAVVLGTVLLSFAPFLSSEFISNFAATISLWFQNFEFNASVYYVIRWIGYQTVGWNIIETAGKILPIIVILFILVVSLFRKTKTLEQLITAMLLCISVYFLLATTVHPWYMATPLILSIFTKYKFPIVWSFMVFLSYSAYTATGFNENLWLVFFEYTAVIGVFIWEVRRSKNKKMLKVT